MTAIIGFKGVRGDILVALRREQPLTAHELGTRFGLTANALRRHLKELEDSGLVRYRREVHGVGGPRYVYSLTERGEQLFPREYVSPLADALDVVRAEQGPEGVIRLFRRRWEALAQQAAPERAGDDEKAQGKTLAERASALAAVLTANGYMAESESGGPGEARIREHNCAVREIVQRFPEVCTAEAEFIAETLGASVERHQHMMSGCQSCEYTARESAPTPVTRLKRKNA